MPTPVQRFRVWRGTNISHWLSQSDQRGELRRAKFTQADVERIAQWGFDHIRLPVDEEQLWDEAGRPDREAFDLLDNGLDWAAQAGLKVVVDLHLLRSHCFCDQNDPRLFTDPQEQIKFVTFWRELSNRLKCRPIEQVAYELMNESVAHDPEDWNRVASAAYRAIRELEPQRVIVLGSNQANSVFTFQQLWVPEDHATLLTFHYYHPMLITHYKASWWPGGGDYDGPIQYPGEQIPAQTLSSLPLPLHDRLSAFNRHYDRETMAADLAQPLAVAAKTGLPLYCGEFGVHSTVPLELRKAWYRDWISVLDQNHIGWANWDYRGCFGIVDENRQSTGIAEVMLGNPPPTGIAQ
ncbi:MAG: glycoside hydrolase family 5 protein [Chthoniobacteraceae bacterium]